MLCCQNCVLNANSQYTARKFTLHVLLCGIHKHHTKEVLITVDDHANEVRGG